MYHYNYGLNHLKNLFTVAFIYTINNKNKKKLMVSSPPFAVSQLKNKT